MKRLLLVVCLICLSGCSWMKFWDSDDGDSKELDIEPAKLVDFNETVELRKLWSSGGVSDIGAGIGNLRPALGSDAIYIADGKGNVKALSISQGKQLWTNDLDIELTGGVGLGGGQLLLGSVDGDIFVLSEETGEILWTTRTSSEILSAPASNGKQVVVQTQDGHLEAYDADSGARLWGFEIEAPILTIRGTSSPTITDTMVMAAFANGKVYAFKAETGLLLWEARVAIPRGRTELERIVDIDGDLLLVDDVVYAASFQGRLGAFSRGTGRALWFQDVSSHQTPAYGLSQIYTTDEDDFVSAYRANSGQPLWTNEQMRYRQLSSPIVFGGYVAVADNDGYLHLLSQTDGSFAGRQKVDGSGVSANMLSNGDQLFVLANDGGLTAYGIK